MVKINVLALCVNFEWSFTKYAIQVMPVCHRLEIMKGCSPRQLDSSSFTAKFVSMTVGRLTAVIMEPCENGIEAQNSDRTT